MLTYRRLERAVWALFVAYALAAVCQQLVVGGPDRYRFFPFVSWALFAKVHREITDYGVRVRELNGELVSPNGADNGGERVPALATIDAYRLIQELGRALGKDDRDKVARVRRALEGIYFSEAEPFRYDVVRRTYDPLVRWHGGPVRSAETVAQFDSRADP